MKVFLFQIMDRNWGFRVVACVSADIHTARTAICEMYGYQSEKPNDRYYPICKGECELEGGHMVSMEFQE